MSKILERVTLTGLKRITRERQTLAAASLLLRKHGFETAAGDVEFLTSLYSIDIRDGWREYNGRGH